MGEFAQVRFALVAVHQLERLGCAPVKSHALLPAEFAVEAVADQSVRKAQSAAARRQVADHASCQGLVEKIEQLVAGTLAHCLERIQTELSAQDRGLRQ